MPYVGNLKDIPKGWFLCNGENGTPNLQNQFLMGSGDYASKNFIKAGLPNITGQIWLHGDPMYSWTSGSLYAIGKDINTTPTTVPQTGYTCLVLDASKSSPVYGGSTTVQPPSYTVYFIIRLK